MILNFRQLCPIIYLSHVHILVPIARAVGQRCAMLSAAAFPPPLRSRMSATTHSAWACTSKVRREDNVDFLQPHTGLHTLSLDMTDMDQWEFDFEVAGADCVMHRRRAWMMMMMM